MPKHFQPLPEIPPNQFALDLAREDLERARFCGYEFHVNRAGQLRWSKSRSNTKNEKREFMAIMEVMDQKKVAKILKMDFNSGKYQEHKPAPVEVMNKPKEVQTNQVALGI